MRPKLLLDLFCGAGGAAMGYWLAGFDVVGVDINPQPNYPSEFEFIQADALSYLGEIMGPQWCWTGPRLADFDAIHASPPCQAFTAYNRRPDHVGDYPDLIAPARSLLDKTGLPYVIENIPGAPLQDPITLCGSSFGLNVRRHRCFESNVALHPPACVHTWQTPRYKQATNRKNLRSTVEVGVWRIPLDVQRHAMGVDWDVALEELSEAIPPAYTRFVGAQLLAHLEAKEAA